MASNNSYMVCLCPLPIHILQPWLFAVWIHVMLAARMLMQLYDLALITFINSRLAVLMPGWHPCLLSCSAHLYPMCICHFCLMTSLPIMFCPWTYCPSCSAYQYVFWPLMLHKYVPFVLSFPHEYFADHYVYSTSVLSICIDLILYPYSYPPTTPCLNWCDKLM